MLSDRFVVYYRQVYTKAKYIKCDRCNAIICSTIKSEIHKKTVVNR